MFPVNAAIRLTITAENGVGRGGAMNEPTVINTATRSKFTELRCQKVRVCLTSL